MTDTVLVVLGGLALLTLVGLAVLAPLRPGHRAPLLPAAPVLGAGLVACVLSWTSFVTSSRGGLAVVAVVAVLLVVVGWRRGTRPWRLDLRAVAVGAALTAVGAVAATVASLPSVWAGDTRPIHPNPSHDIFYYVAEAAWLTEAPISPVPELGAVPGEGTMAPADQPIRSALTFPVRIGQPLVHSAVLLVSGTEAVDAPMAVLALWVALVAPAAFVGGRLLRLPPAAAGALAVLVGSSALLLHQAYQQNSDSILGVATGLLALGAVVAAVQRRTPMAIGALSLASVAAVYVELLLYLVPAVAGAVLLARPVRHAGARLLRVLRVVALALLLGGPAWVRGVLGLLVDRSHDASPSPFFSDGWWPAAARVVGATPLTDLPGSSRAGALLVVLAVVGLLVGLLLSRRRAVWWPLVLVGGAAVAVATLDGRGYTQMRSVVLLAPFVTVVVVDGWSSLVRGVARRWAPGGRDGWWVVARGAVVVGLIASVTVYAAVNLRTGVRSLDRDYALSRHVDESFDDVAEWAQRWGGPDGEDLTVVVPDFFSQQWVGHQLREARAVAYPETWLDYFGTRRHWAGEVDAYVLVGPGAVVDAPAGSVVARNDRFTLVDTRQGDVVVATPVGDPALWSHHVDEEGDLSGSDLAVLTVLRSSGEVGPVDLLLDGVPAGTPVAVSVDGSALGTSTTGPAGSIRVDLGDRSTAALVIDLGADGVGGGGTFELEGVRDVD